ncbi:hypothetical protein SAMN05660649_02088 [Desulfotomaculum arcticum]|uniref:Uncharacterized protein n=1 Tax=Desulfotruncus arcticus DSM 17038 TaxID=1121424 RepID=A0A1I2T794_9FIRM|nr:hypothetical protein SAMN05660649_02088 [Desulfotomaculum arcticum] [Desulfotruncus arcticus DSM 17038]
MMKICKQNAIPDIFHFLLFWLVIRNNLPICFKKEDPGARGRFRGKAVNPLRRWSKGEFLLSGACQNRQQIFGGQRLCQGLVTN